ncbi:transposase [Pelomonas sp. Root1444]|uniref:IS66-like element accessory protein TnpA n=1 Tax=Pelomonas sp. Root1444 TaxID=1736464 RepID=UPI0007038F47|nr:transposase [Pelomonas sp. Root1444]KQY90741.1 hypothetical protein ASD35_02745 [Pelomonas sp. Root1444]
MQDTKPARRRRHDADLKRAVLAECSGPGASVASIVLAHGLNANLVHKWRREARDLKLTDDAAAQTAFVPVALTAPIPAPRADVRIELRRGQVCVNVEWPLSAMPTHSASRIGEVLPHRWAR